MSRMTPVEGRELYLKSPPPPVPIRYNPDEHEEEMKDLATGLIGAMLLMQLPSLSGPELGSRIPLLVLHLPGDLIRIMIDPDIKKEQDGVTVTALSYSGERMVIDTSTLWYAPYEAIEKELLWQKDILAKAGHVPPSDHRSASPYTTATNLPPYHPLMEEEEELLPEEVEPEPVLEDVVQPVLEEEEHPEVEEGKWVDYSRPWELPAVYWESPEERNPKYLCPR